MEPEDKRKLEQIHKALLGDPFDPSAPPGVLKMLEDHEIQIYGCPETRTIGLKEMVQVIWDGRTKLIAICAAAGMLFGFLAWLIPLIFHK